MAHSATAADADRTRAMAMVVSPSGTCSCLPVPYHIIGADVGAARGTCCRLRWRGKARIIGAIQTKNAGEEEMKRLAAALMLGAVCIQPVAVRAADWPTRPIRII